MGPRNALGYGGHIHLGVCTRIRIAREHFRCAKARSASLAVPELTRGVDIQVNERVWLRFKARGMDFNFANTGINDGLRLRRRVAPDATRSTHRVTSPFPASL